MADERKPPDDPQGEVQGSEELTEEQLDRVAAGYAAEESNEIAEHKSGPTNYNKKNL